MNLEKAVESVRDLLDFAKNFILIKDGHFDPKLYQANEVVYAMKRAAKRGVKIGVICDYRAPIVNAELAELVESKAVTLYRRNISGIAGRQTTSLGHRITQALGHHFVDTGHYTVVDGYHTWAEKPHKLQSAERKVTCKVNDKEEARKYTQDFMKNLRPTVSLSKVKLYNVHYRRGAYNRI
jgi:hypothetical protein